MWLIVGLGNPGPRYRATRHNLGFMLVERVAARAGIKVSKPRGRALVGRGSWLGEQIVLAEPQTYMNLSGLSVAELMNELRLDRDSLVVAHDDVDLPLGRGRLAAGGGSGGHKGVVSIINALGDQDFIRLRMGIGRPQARDGQIDEYVLQEFEPGEREAVEAILERAARALETLLTRGLSRAQDEFNRAAESLDGAVDCGRVRET